MKGKGRPSTVEKAAHEEMRPSASLVCYDAAPALLGGAGLAAPVLAPRAVANETFPASTVCPSPGRALARRVTAVDTRVVEVAARVVERGAVPASPRPVAGLPTGTLAQPPAALADYLEK